jgi:hypothetical protein
LGIVGAPGETGDSGHVAGRKVQDPGHENIVVK